MQLSIVLKLFYILGSLLSVFLLFYFMFTSNFNRMEYYILFGYQLILLGFTLISNIVQTLKDDCSLKNHYMGSTLLLSIVFVLNALIVMWANLYFGLKYINFGSNILWTFLWLQAWSCSNILIGFIGIIHGVLAVLGLIIFLVLNIMKKNNKTAKCYKYLYTASIILLIFSYIVCWIAEPTTTSCQAGQFFVLAYQKFGLIEIISPILLLMFLNTEMGDPRDRMLKEEIKNFGKGQRDNMGFVIDDTN